MEKKGELVVYRTPGGGVGQESRRLQQTYSTQTDTPSDTNSSAMLGTSREVTMHESVSYAPPRVNFYIGDF